MENLDQFRKVTDLSDQEYRILESTRFQDHDQSVKAGAILAFSGLMIATSIVQLSTSQQSVIHVGESDISLLLLNIAGLFLLFLSSIITVMALVSRGRYPHEKAEALIKFDEYVKSKSKKVSIASYLLSGGAFCVISALMVKLISHFF